MLGIEPTHPHKELLTSYLWGSYFYHPRQSNQSSSRVVQAFRKMSASVASGVPSSHYANPPGNGRRSASLKRVASMRSTVHNSEEETTKAEQSGPAATSAGVTCSVRCPPSEDETVVGPSKINTLWGSLIRDHARMCIPDLEVLLDYPIDFRFPAFSNSRSRSDHHHSGFFPADPISLHSTAKR